MTQEEILAMEAGIRLDIEVAENLMGKQIVAGRTASSSSQIITTSEVPHYSTDISAAWQVVERIVGAGFCIAPKVIITNDEVGWYCSILSNAPREEGKVVALGDTAPEAICKAARRYVEEVGND